MARTSSQIKALINSKLGKAAGTISSSDFLAGMNLSLDALRLRVDFAETAKTANLSPASFTDVSVYAIPSDMLGDDILDIRPLVDIPSEVRNQNWDRNSNAEFTRNLLDERATPKYNIEYNNGSRTLRLLDTLSAQVKNTQLHSCDTYDGNGTWTADATTSDANTVATDSVNYFEGSGSVSFNATVAQSVNNKATIYNPGFATVDASNQSNSPYLFFYAYIPDVTYVTSLTFVYGSDTAATPATKANYYSFTATTQFDGSALQTGKNLIGVPRSGATQTGTVVNTTIKYLEFTVNYSASQANTTGFRLDGIYLRDGQLFEVRYRTQNIVQATGGGTKKQYFTLDDDVLLLNAEGEVLYIEFTAGYLAPNVKSPTSGQTLGEQADMSLARYSLYHPSDRKLMKRNWYYV